MSILLEGVDMPKGTNMMLLISPKGEVWEMGDLLGNDKLIDGAKAIPVPPHGDLIDRDALMDDIIGSMVFSSREVPKEAAIVQKVLDIVGDANAIIEAEKEEQE